MACPEVAGVDPRLVLYDRRHADVYAEWLELLGDPDAAEDAAQWALLSAAQGVEDDEVSRRVHAALPDLPVAARTALLLRERERLTYPEVAERLGVAQSTAERVVYVARMRLVEALGRIKQALNLAPLLGWLKSTAAGLTAAKGVAAVATLGAAAGLSALVPVGGSEPAGKPAQTLETRSPQSASVAPSAEPGTRASRRPVVRSGRTPSRTRAAAVTPNETASPAPRVVPPTQASATPPPEPASDNLSLAPIGAPQPIEAPAVSEPPALPAPPAVEVPVLPTLVEIPVVPDPAEVVPPLPNAELPPLP